MLGALGKILRRFDWDVMVGVTDLPIRFESRTLVVEVADAQPIALDSLPALGAVNIHRRVSATVADLAWSMRGCLDDNILVGGAPGSGFESKDDILRATYGQRERYRRQSSADDH
ncbi:MAG: hypothetical protein JWN05_70 [Arthrobacter sp.]|nr:hypothetical protein [Arthrobacter sp.]